MRANLPSRTATIVSAARYLSGEGVSPIGGDVDGLAPLLSPPHAAGWLSRIARMTRSSRMVAKVVRTVSGGLVDHAGLRTRYIDGVAREAAGGIGQMVVLGAGLDARAYRLEALLHLPLFEVDHPATQGWKRQAASRIHRTGGVRHVSVDFLVDRLSDRLVAEGFDVAVPTLWVWEGVTPYLTAAARQATLAEIGNLSAPGSWLVESYILPALASIPPLLLPLVRAAFDGLGEPLLGGITTEEIQRELADAGWQVTDDAGTMEWVASFAGGDGPGVALLERVVVCRR